MKLQKSNLSNKNHEAMDKFIGRVLDAYKDGVITKKSAIAGFAQVMAALDIQNTSEAISWFNQEGVEFFQDLDTKF